MKCFKCNKELKIGELYFLHDFLNDKVPMCVVCYAKIYNMGNLYAVGTFYDLVFNKNFSEVKL